MNNYTSQISQNIKKVNYEKMDKTKLFQKLLELIVNLYETYDESICSQEVHFENQLQFHKLNEECKKFVFEIFDGIVINKNFFDDFVQGLINSKIVGVSRGRLNEYKVVIFLIVFRFEDISYNELKFFLYCQDHLMVYTILNFMFDKSLLQEFVLPQLEKHYDTSYCLDIFKKLEIKSQKMKKLFQKLKQKTSCQDNKEQQSIKSDIPKKKSPTKFEPFNLTKPKERPVSQKTENIIQEIPQKTQIKVDYTITVKDIEKNKKVRRQKLLQEKVEELQKQKGPELNTLQRAQEKQLNMKEEEPVQQIVKVKDDTYKEILYKEVDIPEQRQWTKAMLLKEKQAEELKIQEDAKAIQKLESNLRDSQEFKQWQLMMEEQDEQKKMQEIIQRKEENLMANINMKKAVEREIKQKNKQAKKLKIDMQKQIKQKSIEEKQEIQKKQKQVKQAEKEKENCKKKQILQHKEKQKLAQDKKKKLQDELKLKKLQQIKEREEKAKLIKKIREFEKRVFQLSRFAQPKEIQSEFLIENFTILQLKERYKEIKNQYEIEAESKRKEILEEKEKEKQELDKIKQKLMNKKQKQKTEFLKRKQQKEKEKLDLKQKLQQKELSNDQLALKKITEKKQQKLDEQKRIDKIEKDFRMKQQFKKQESNMLQVLKNMNLQIGKENISKNTQVNQLKAEYQENLAKTKFIDSKQSYLNQQVLQKQTLIDKHEQIIRDFEKDLQFNQQQILLYIMKKYSFVKQTIAQKIDQTLFNKYGLKEPLAMELAGQGVAHSTYHFFQKYKNYNKILILCGPGNNGGDGLVAARHLSKFDSDLQVDLIQTAEYNDDHKNGLIESLQYLENVKLEKLGNIQNIKEKKVDIILDALFGFSFKGPIRDNYKDLFEFLNTTQIPIISCDVPSGWNIDEGNVYSTFTPKANISLSSLKNCMKDFSNEHYFIDHFIPRALLKEFEIENPKYEKNTDLFVKIN